MKQELDLIKWEELLQPLSIDESWKKFKEVICKLESNYIPLRKIPKKLSRKPVWMTYKAAKMVRKKHKTYTQSIIARITRHTGRLIRRPREKLRRPKENLRQYWQNILRMTKNHFSHMFAVRLRQSQESEH